MGIAIDTVGFYRTAGTAADSAPAAATVANGDSFTVRSFAATASARLEDIFFAAAHNKNVLRVRSPMLHDNVRGIEITQGESPCRFILPRDAAQMLTSQDTLVVEAEVITASETDVGALSIYYTDLLGAAARLHSWGDISGIIKSIKPLQVAVTPSGTAGTWVDTVITTTEDLLHANRDYAVLGYILDAAAVAVGIKGTETGNLRVCGPALITTPDTVQYFVDMSNLMGTPHIPVINSANKDSIYVSLLSNLTSGTVNVQLILAELTQNLAS